MMSILHNHTFTQEVLFQVDCQHLIGTHIGNNLVTESYRILGIEAKKFDSNGFVLAESARAFPGDDRPLVMHGSGHLQMRNDSNLRSKFAEILFSDIHRPFFNLNR